jgi:Family of unknown function (DUF6058)
MSHQQQRRTVSSVADLAYIRAELRAIDVPNSSLPAPSYHDADGTAYVPNNYTEQEADRERFTARAFAESKRLNTGYDDAWIAQAWESYWDGIYGMCLKDNSPENIVRKNWLIDRIEALIDTPLHDEPWITELAECVNDLDALERPFCDFDRAYFGGSVSRDRCITTVRQRFPEIVTKLVDCASA